MNVKINNKVYEHGQLGFKDMVKMEDIGFSVIELFQGKKMFSMVTAYVAVIADCTRDDAENLIEQHVMGGGSIESIYESFSKAIGDSGFFKKLLKEYEQEKTEVPVKRTAKK